MNQQNAREYLPLVETLADGELEGTDCDGNWIPILNTSFDAAPDQYRRKPKAVKMYVATWFGKEGALCSFESRDKDVAMNWSDGKGFKIHELDCGSPE